MKAESLKIATICAASLLASATAWAYTNGQDWIGGGDDALFSTQANWQGGRATDSTAALRFDGQAGKTVTFDDVYGNTDYLWIGSTSADTYITDVANWTLKPIVWEATESTNGLNKTGGDFLIADAANQYGALRIKSGTYTVSGKVHIGKAGKADLTIDGGMFTANSEFNVGISGATSRFTMNGGVLNIGATSYWGADANTVATATIAGGVVTSKTVNVVNNSGSCTIDVCGGTFTATEDMWFGPGSGTATLNVSNGGYFGCGTETSGKWFKFGENGTATRTINLNEGGTLGAWHFENFNTGTAAINFNGGTLKVLGTDSNYSKYILGSHDHKDDSLTVTVNAQGGTLDTNGKNVMIKNVVIGGTGTLRITGGGTVTFEAKPTCPVLVEEGVLVGNEYLPANLTFGTNGFVKFDLSAIAQEVTDNGDGTSTTNAPGAAQTLASGVTIAVPAGDAVAEHVIVKNDGTLAWEVAYSASTLTASAQLASEAAPTVTVWTGDYTSQWTPRSNNYNTRWDEPGNWTSGVPDQDAKTTKTIIPSAISRPLYFDSNGWRYCGDMVLCTTNAVHLFSEARYCPYVGFAPRSISGSGSIIFGGMGLVCGTADYSAEINVPVTIANHGHYNGSGFDTFVTYISANTAASPINLNRTLTIPADVPCRIEHNVNINGDLSVDGTLTLSGNTPELKGAIAGSGVIEGSFTTAEGATLYATVTNANATAEHLTVTGSADISNATVEIAGGDLVADAAVGTEIILLKATGVITWTKKSYVIPGQTGVWKIVTDTVIENEGEENETTYNVLKAVKANSGFIIIISDAKTAIDNERKYYGVHFG